MAFSSSSPPRNAAVSPPLYAGSPNLSNFLTSSCKVDDDSSSLVGWWFGVSKDGKDPSGHIIQISAEHGRYLARSYSPWRLATANKGTPLFEIYDDPSSEEGEDKKKAIYLKHKAAAQVGKGMDYEPDVNPLSMPIFYLTPAIETDGDLAVRTIMNLVAANPRNATNPIMKMACSELNIDPNILTKAANRDSSNDQTVIWIEFAIGNFKEKKKTGNNKKKKSTGKLKKELHRVPAALERKGCLSFCLTVEEDKDQQFSDKILKGYRTVDHVILDIAECMGKGKRKKIEDDGEFWPLMCSQALNKQPVLSGLTTFNKINVTAAADPLTGLYTASNGYFVTEVLQFTRKFEQWQENGEIGDPSEIEPYDYVEAVRLTGDPDVPAGQVAFRAKVGEKYKLSPGSVLEKKFGAVGRYKGKGRLTGFQKSRWVDVEVIILGEEYRKDGFALGLLYSASKYRVLKLLKQMSLPSFL